MDVAKFASPCAISSTLELCLSPLIPSATTAESRLSTAASKATVRAEGSRGKIRSVRKGGNWNDGRPVGIPPNFVPIVSTGSFRTMTTKVPTNSAMIDPGIRFVM